MNVHIANYEPDRRGGGWTAARYLHDGLNATDYDNAEVYLICGPTMVAHSDVEKAKRDGKRIVLRVDNAVRNSRNRGTGMTRMKSFAEMADLVVYQSKWAREFLYPFTKKDGVVILNGVDTNLFNAEGRNAPDDSYLYVRSSRDEGKQWIMGWYWFVNKPGKLEIVGKFSYDNIQYNFDFYNNENFVYLGEQKHMPDVYKRNKYFLYTYLNDACSNTLLEARASGCEIVDVYGMLQTGGASEIMACKDISVERMIKEYEVAIGQLV